MKQFNNVYNYIIPQNTFIFQSCMQLSTKVAYNTIIQAFSKSISTALGLVGIAIITRYLGQTGFGEYTTIITFISFFATIADFRFNFSYHPDDQPTWR